MNARLLALCIAVGTLVAPVALVIAQNPLAAQPAAAPRPFVGSFKGEKLSLELAADKADDAYTGTILFNGQRFPCRATAKGQTLSGSFKTPDGNSYPFTATLAGTKLSLESGGTKYALTAPATPTNPLGQPDAPKPVAPAASEEGGVGIAWMPGEDGGLTVRDILPGGPADKAKLKPGGVLRAIDGKRVDGLSLAQMRGMIVGPVGSTVTLTIETADEVSDVILVRAPLPQQQPQQPPVPNGPNPPANPPPPVAPPAAANLPRWMTPGTRLTWQGGNSTVPNVTTVLKPDENGNWINPQTGQRYGPQELGRASGGVGYFQLTVVGADVRETAAERRDFLITDVNTGACQFQGASGMIGNASRLGDLWINPAELAQMGQMNQQGVQTQRVQYTLNGQTYNAISLLTQMPNAYTSQVYDLESGLLLSMSTCHVGEDVMTPDPTGRTSTPARGTAQISHARLMAVRPTQLPWAGDGIPAIGQNGMTFVGQQNTSTGAGAPFTARLTSALQFGPPRPGWIPARQTTRIEYGGSTPPQDATVDRVLGSAMCGALYINPRTLAAMQPNAVIDEDPITRYRTIYVGNNNGMAVIAEQGQVDALQYGYDANTGALVGIGLTKDMGGIGKQETQLQLAR